LKRVKVLKLKEELIEEDIKRTEAFRETLHKTFWPKMNKEVKDLILNEIYEKKILEEKTLERSRSKDIVKDSIQNTMEIYNEYEKKIVEYVENKRRERCMNEITVEKIV
jgi:adenylate kinase family enzyme